MKPAPNPRIKCSLHPNPRLPDHLPYPKTAMSRWKGPLLRILARIWGLGCLRVLHPSPKPIFIYETPRVGLDPYLQLPVEPLISQSRQRNKARRQLHSSTGGARRGARAAAHFFSARQTCNSMATTVPTRLGRRCGSSMGCPRACVNGAIGVLYRGSARVLRGGFSCTQTPNHEPQTLNSKLYTLNPKP